MKNFIGIIAAALLLLSTSVFAQKDSTAGEFTLGMRSTLSTFTDAGSQGLGAGGEFRIRVTKHMNTEWYADYITTNIQSLGFRRDAHIGWSVLFYMDKDPLVTGQITPYFLAGQCFDYTNVYSDYFGNHAERWSAAAAQGGVGLTWRLTNNFDLSTIAQYMMHLGAHVQTDILTSDTGQKELEITKGGGASLDGHLLLTLALNYKLGKL
ncbi:MAG TPA: hypothetical protein VN922_19990 [Bacteroidia bacterium]|nr:hypothetical protein [Bacteroidia bacterium]